ncbi:unnamed protein product, partial [Linum tenue]
SSCGGERTGGDRSGISAATKGGIWAGFGLRDKTNVKRHRRNPPPSPPPQPEEDEEEEDAEVAAQVRAQGVKTFR